MGLAYIDSRVVPLDEARIPIMDRGYLLGDGVFETLRVAQGNVFMAAEHRARLETGLRAIGLDPELVGAYDQAVESLVAAGGDAFGPDLYIRVNVTGGAMLDVADGDNPAVTGICRPFQPYPMKLYAQGARCILAGRKDRLDPLAVVKSLSFLPYVVARRQAQAVAAHDAIMLNDEGRVAEATTSNVFAVIDGTVYAPGADEGALDGVTRQAVLSLVAEAGADVETRIDADALLHADEVFLTNTTGGVVPVARIGDHVISEGKGPMTTSLGVALDRLVHQ